MTSEASFIAALRHIATASAARGLRDDAAVLNVGGTQLVLTMDAIVEGVHFLADDPPDTVAWKLVATNVSDLTAKGARPSGCLLTYPLTADEGWNASFLCGLDAACTAFGIPLLGGDTIRQPPGSSRSFALVAMGEATCDVVPARSGAKPGDLIWVSGWIGDAGLGLALLQGKMQASPADGEALIACYRRPAPQPAAGIALAPHVTAMMDISDGLLIDASRLACASEVAAVIALERVPLSSAFVVSCGDGVEQRLKAASAGDDYCLLFTADPASSEMILDQAAQAGSRVYPVGRIEEGQGLHLENGGDPVPLPDRLGFEH